MFKLYQSVFLFLSFVLLFSNAFGQGASNKGTDFWLGYGKHVSTGKMVVYITSDVSTTATVSVANAVISTVAVPANGIVAVDIPTSAHLDSDGLFAKGIHITSLKPIIVYAHIYAESVSGATLVLPVNALGKDYYSINYKQISNSKGAVSWFFIVAVEDNTQVEITPSQATQGGWDANTTHTVTLNKGEIYNVLAKYTDVNANNKNNDVFSYGDDLTGSKIKSVSSSGNCKKIAVFSGSSKITINSLDYSLATSGAVPNPGSADNLFQQAYPTDTWGKNFINIPQKSRAFVVYRIVKSDPSAVVKVNGIPVNYSNSIYYDFESQQIEQISSDKPIQVVQYAVTQGKGAGGAAASGDVGDPEMIYLNPLEQTLTNITMYSTGRFKILKHFINVVIKNSGVASFTVDGISISSDFVPVPSNSEYSYAQLSVNEGTHNLSSLTGFNAIAYGFGAAESYGYAAGANLTAFGIDPVILGNVDKAVETGCVGVNYNLTLKLPYIASQIEFDSGDGLKIFTLPSYPATSMKDGKTIYIYSLIPLLTYAEAKTYSYRVITTKPSADACGSGDEFLFDFLINPKPVAGFAIPIEVCVDDPVIFKAERIVGQTIIEYLWDFNGESTAITENTEHIYTTDGVKLNRLSVKSEDGCWSDLKEIEIEVMPLPLAKFSQQSISCVGGVIQFTDESTISKSTVTKWEWNFGDPSSASNTTTEKNPSHVFSEVRNYDVTLKVTTDLGCENIITKKVKINTLPIADFETPDICLNDASALFTNTSTISDGSALAYVWDFGDSYSTPANNKSTLKNPTHAYSRAQNYTVSLTVTSLASGCVTIVNKLFTVNGSIPKALFTVQNDDKLCSNQEVIFEDLASVDFGEVTKIEWIYDTANSSMVETDISPATRNERIIAPKLYKHTYPTFFTPATQTVTVKMMAYSGVSCFHSYLGNVVLKAVPKVDFTLPSGCLPNGEAAFTNQSTFDGKETDLTFLWDFGDGSATVIDKNPVHKFRQAKDYQITLTVTAANGCVNTITQTLTVKGAIPEPSFSVENNSGLCSDQTITFTDATKIAFGELTKIEWDFDLINYPNDPAYQIVDNSPAPRSQTSKNYQFSYPKFSAPATLDKKVRMRVMENGNCISEVEQIITLKAVPNVEFNNLTNVCAEILPFAFTQASETTGFTGVGVYSGNGVDDSGVFSPAKAGIGTHPITYTFVGDNGCSAAKTQNITVFATPTVDAGSDKVILTGGEIVLNATANGNKLTYKWTPKTGLNRDDILNPIASPAVDVIYTLLVTSDEGCVLADKVAVQVLKFPEIPNTFTPNGDGVNDAWAIKYLESYPNCTIKIFNRYGKSVFISEKYIPWDGRLNGNYLPEGMYYYLITAKDGELKYSGSLLLIK